MKLWYFAHPYSGNEEGNFNKCNERTVKLLDLGFKVFSPISHSHHLDTIQKSSLEKWLEIDFAILDRCDGIIMAPGWEKSKGCVAEHGRADRKGYEIRLYEEIVDED